jgi:alkanesulfonate monooxygenase SsuD/methylene tetrahydromethanopterin reductase-like flavin-dependent oxidoreductase (luciferase family)
LNHDGKNFRFIDVPMELEPYQKPHPPLWSGANTPQSMGWQAERGINTIMNQAAPVVKQGIAIYTEAFRKKHGEAKPLPKLGFARFVHIADTEAEAVANARKAYASFIDSASSLYRLNRVQSLNFPPDFDLARGSGALIVGTPAQARDQVAQQLAVAGANYFCARFMIGDLPLEAAIRSAELFAQHVIPHCREAKAA